MLTLRAVAVTALRSGARSSGRGRRGEVDALSKRVHGSVHLTFCLLVAVIWPLWGGASEAAGQVAQISAVPTCADCEIGRERVAVLGSIDDAELLHETLDHVARDSRGRFYAGALVEGGVLVYAGDGSYLRSVGVRGPGPMEIGRGLRGVMVTPGDTLLVIDEQIKLFTLDGELIRTAPGVGVSGGRSIALAHPRLYVARIDPASEGPGVEQRHLWIDRAGHVRWSVPSRGIPPACGRCSARPLTVLPESRGSFVVAGHRNRYEFHLLHPDDGRLVATYRVTDAPWFEREGWESDSAVAALGLAPSAAFVTRALHARDDGRIWVIGYGSSPSVRDAGDLPMFMAPSDIEALREQRRAGTISHVDLIDLTDRRVIARQSFAGMELRKVQGADDLFWQLSYSPEGVVQAEIFRLIPPEG
jgi:hypothetical protein